MTWSDLSINAILAHLRSILRGLKEKGVPVTLVQTATGVVITITLPQLAAKPVAAPQTAPAIATPAAPAEPSAVPATVAG